MATLPSFSIGDIVREDEKKKHHEFLEEMKEFPCLFNLGSCKLDVGSTVYGGIRLCEPDIPKSMWESLREDLNREGEDSEFDEPVWKGNLLTRVYAKLGSLEDASKLNVKILSEHGQNNLVALANAVFLFNEKGDINKAKKLIDHLRKLKSDQQFDGLKVNAVCELGYAFRKFAGAKNLQFSASLLEFVLLFRTYDERIQFMLALVYRRCTHFHIYAADPENINRHDCALKAAKSLYKIATTSIKKSVKAEAFIELAYLKYEDDKVEEHNKGYEHGPLKKEEWFQIVQEMSWSQLRDEAVRVGECNLSENVLKMAGQLYRYSGDLDESKKFLEKAIVKKSTSRAHHHLALTYKKMAFNFEHTTHPEGYQNTEGDSVADWCKKAEEFVKNILKIKPKDFVKNVSQRKQTSREFNHQDLTYRQEYNIQQQCFQNNRAGANVCGLNVLPEPQINNSPPKMEQHLKYIAKVPDQFKPFSTNNPFTYKVIYHLEQSVKLSFCQNKAAVYELASILVNTENYDKSKEMCKILFKECASSRNIPTDPVYLVNAYNLYGVCCTKQAEVDQANAESLLAESEEHLILAVRLASNLAATVPELAMCATDLWKAFRTLERKFTFEGQKESREKLYRICEFISDYRCLEAVDEIVSQDPNELDKMEVIEQCLQRYLNMEEYDSALLFRDLINLRPKVRSKLPKSKVNKQLMLKVAEGKLDETYVKREAEAYHPDPIWKQLFHDEFHIAGKSRKYDIVIVCDVDNDYEPKHGMPSDIISEYLSLVLQHTFGLNAVHAHDESCPGSLYLEEQLKIISNSWVAIFVLTDPCLRSYFPDSEVTGLRISESEKRTSETADLNEEIQANCSPEVVTVRTEKSENFMSRMFERIVNASVSNHVHNIGTFRIVIVFPDNLKREDLPQCVQDLPDFVLVQSDIEACIDTSQSSSYDHCIEMTKKIFRTVVFNE